MELFDPISVLSQPLHKAAQVRNRIGDIAARFAAAAMGFELLPIKQNQECCPDFRLRKLHGEIKSVGLNRRALLYKWRVEKEARNFDPESYLYIFVLHACPITCADLSNITEAFRDGDVTLCGVTLAELQAIVAGKPVRKFSMFRANHDPTIGYNRPGYSDGGWQFHTKLLPTVPRRRSREVSWLGSTKKVVMRVSPGWIAATA